MTHSLKTTELFSYLTACILGVLFHFIYEWSGENAVAGLFFPINESTWEHLKLIFFPILFVSVLESLFLKQSYQNFICVKLLSSLLGMFLTVVCFYTYLGVYGKNSDVTNILIYFLSMGAAYLFSYHALNRKRYMTLPAKFCYLGFAFMLVLFFIFTLFPPKIGLFLPPSL